MTYPSSFGGSMPQQLGADAIMERLRALLGDTGVGRGYEPVLLEIMKRAQKRASATSTNAGGVGGSGGGRGSIGDPVEVPHDPSL